MTVRPRSDGRRGAAGSAAVAVALLAMASLAEGREAVGLDDALPLSTSCTAKLKAPRLLQATAVELPDAVWKSRATIPALVSFRLDQAGHPTSVLATAAGFDQAAKPLFEAAVVDGFKRFLFCPAGDYSTTIRWTGRLVFVPLRADQADTPLYLQSFEPAYLGLERFGRRVGRVVVRGTYGIDGRPRAVQVAETSGDEVLDQRSVDVLVGARLVFHNGVAPSQPVRVERPFTYQP